MICTTCQTEHEHAILAEREQCHLAVEELATIRPRISELEHKLAIEVGHHRATGERLAAVEAVASALRAELAAMRSDRRERDAARAPTAVIHQHGGG